MSDTPRTDAECRVHERFQLRADVVSDTVAHVKWVETQCVAVHVARTLERELTAARAEVETLKAQDRDAVAWLARAEDDVRALRAEVEALRKCIRANAALCAGQTKDILCLRRELSHLVFLLEPLERDGTLNVPGLATLNGARAVLTKEKA
jgi:capsule polysaccharide export protein KpsE/RkpR